MSPTLFRWSVHLWERFILGRKGDETRHTDRALAIVDRRQEKQADLRGAPSQVGGDAADRAGQRHPPAEVITLPRCQCACNAHDELVAFVKKIAAIKMCDDERTECQQGSGPYCAIHGDLYIDDEIKAARALLAKAGA